MKTQLISEPIPPTHHCITGSIWRVAEFQGFQITEDMLLGMGSGVGFVYWQQKDTVPFLGGRANVGRPSEEGLERAVARICGAKLVTYRGGSSTKAIKHLVDHLQSSSPVALQVDMGYLPYFNFPEEFHFGGHVVAAMGYDDEYEKVCIADREEKLYWVDMIDLAKARSSRIPPFMPNNHAWVWDFRQAHMPKKDDLCHSIRSSAQFMLHPPIRNLGVPGIRTAADRILKWPQSLSAVQIDLAIFNLYIFIDATGGTGGGLFRYMYSRFIKECGMIFADNNLISIAKQMEAVGDEWQEIAVLGKYHVRGSDPAALLSNVSRKLNSIAEHEKEIWTQLAVWLNK